MAFFRVKKVPTFCFVFARFSFSDLRRLRQPVSHVDERTFVVAVSPAEGGHSVGGSDAVDAEAPLHRHLVPPRGHVGSAGRERLGQTQLLAQSNDVDHGLGPESGAEPAVDEAVDGAVQDEEDVWDVVEAEDPEGEGGSAYIGAADGPLNGNHLLEAQKNSMTKN